MRKKDIQLFSEAIHNVKKIVAEIKQERKEQQQKDNKRIKELLVVVDELYELFDDLTNGKKESEE